MFDDENVALHYHRINETQERIAESYRRWLLSYEQAKLDPYARLMERKCPVVQVVTRNKA